MERLTAQWGNNHAVPRNFSLDFAWDISDAEWQGLTCVLDRLAAYEETELEPEEIKDIITLCKNYTTAGLDAKFIQACIDIAKTGISFDRLRELAEADKDGRCAVLPNIPHNKTLYWVWGDEIMPVHYKGIRGGTVTKDGKYRVSCNMTTKKPRSFAHTYRRKPYTNTVQAGNERMFYADDIGKIVFLTREAAEKALEAMK